jgi:hypothetical protein
MPFHHTTRRTHDTAEASHVTSPLQTGPGVSRVVNRLALDLSSIWQQPSHTNPAIPTQPYHVSSLPAFNLGPCNRATGCSAEQQYKAVNDGTPPLWYHRIPISLIEYTSTASCTRFCTQPRADPMNVLFASELGFNSTTTVGARISRDS